MATSGTYLWSPDLAECVDEAFERCRIDPSSLDSSHVHSARRSINYMLADWATQDNQDFRIDRFTVALVEGQAQYTIDPDTDGRIIDILTVALRRDGSDTTIVAMARDEHLGIPNKDTEGRPAMYFVDKRRTSIILTLWPVPENSTDVLVMDAMRKFTDAGVATNEPDIPYYMREAFVAGLAFRLGEKFAPEPILPRLKMSADESFKKGNGAQHNQGDVRIMPAQHRPYGSRSRRGWR
jgi:hypothetical protein